MKVINNRHYLFETFLYIILSDASNNSLYLCKIIETDVILLF